jgi:hypothetical protein
MGYTADNHVPYHTQNSRTFKKRSMGLLSPKRRRVFLRIMANYDNEDFTARPLQLHASASVKASQSSGPVSSLLLRPCHICHRRPTTRALLGGWIDCEDCEKRTCFICMRECENEQCSFAAREENYFRVEDQEYHQRPQSRRRRICSSCAVENIFDGYDTVTCQDCRIHNSKFELMMSQQAETVDRRSHSMLVDAVSDRF